MKVLDAITNRSSIRAYKDEKLSKETILTLAEAALKAPTARNMQEIHVSVVLGDNPVLEELQADLNPQAETKWYYKAPVVFFLSGQDDFKWTDLDAGIACENIHLAAMSMGLGSIILGITEKFINGEKKAYYNKALGIPEGYSFKIAVAAGYAATEKEPHEIDCEKNITYLNFDI